jgi:hypothetical protein
VLYKRYKNKRGGGGAPLSHLGKKVEEGGGQHAVRLLHDVVKRGRDPVQNGSGNDLKEKQSINPENHQCIFLDPDHKDKCFGSRAQGPVRIGTFRAC